MGSTNKIILITGGAGFIGSNFIHHLLGKSDDINVINYDKLTYAGNPANLRDLEDHPHYLFVKGDICSSQDLSAVFKRFSPDYVINFAAETHVDRSILNPEAFARTNIIGVQNLLKISLDSGIKKYIQISTDEVYGSLGESGYFTEQTPLSPHSPYSASKASADLLTQAYNTTYGLSTVITRCSNNYGPYQFPEKLIPLIILNCLRGKKIPIYGDGLNIRDWLYVEDHCSAIDSVILNGVPGGVYNIGGNNEKTNIEITELIIRTLAEILPEAGISEDLITYVEDRKGHDRRYAIDSTKITKELGWMPATSFEEGIRETIHWYLNNKDWLFSTYSHEYREYYSMNYGGNQYD